LTIFDYGVSLSESFEIKKLDSPGFELATFLVDRLDGELKLKKVNGIEFIIRFNVEKNNHALTSALHLIKVALAHPAASNGVCSRHRSKFR
jgi:hypothetical protein